MATGRAAALSLYRSLLRAHAQHLPEEMKQLGDTYVKSEFRLHRNVSKQEQLDQFFDAWGSYLAQLQQTARARVAVSTGVLDKSKGPETEMNGDSAFSFGRDLDPKVELNEEQSTQLEKLREEARKAGSSGSENQ